jgi:hypothetical protein
MCYMVSGITCLSSLASSLEMDAATAGTPNKAARQIRPAHGGGGQVGQRQPQTHSSRGRATCLAYLRSALFGKHIQ